MFEFLTRYSMIRITTILLVLIASLNITFAQRTELEFIFRPAITSLRGEDKYKTSYKPALSLSAGFGVNIPVSAKVLSVQR